MKQLAIYTLHLQKVAVDVSSSSGLVDSEKEISVNVWTQRPQHGIYGPAAIAEVVILDRF